MLIARLGPIAKALLGALRAAAAFDVLCTTIAVPSVCVGSFCFAFNAGICGAYAKWGLRIVLLFGFSSSFVDDPRHNVWLSTMVVVLLSTLAFFFGFRLLHFLRCCFSQMHYPP